MNERSTQTQPSVELAGELDDLRRRLGRMAPAESVPKEDLDRLGADIRRVAVKLGNVRTDEANGREATAKPPT